MNTKKIISYMLLLLTNVIWGTTFVVVKGAVTSVSAFSLVTLRYLIAALLFLPFVLYYHMNKGVRPTGRDWWGMFWATNLGLTIHAALQYTGLGLSSATNGAVLVSLSPLLVMAFNMKFRGQKITWIQGFGTLLSLIGIVVLVRPVFSLASSKLLGDTLFLLTAFTWAGYSLICTDLTDRLPPFYITSVIGVMAGLEMGMVIIPFGFWRQVWSFSTSIWTAAGYLAVFSSFFCYIFWNKGLQVLGSTSTSHFLFIIPVVSALGSAMFLGERLSFLEVVGALLILWGVWTVNRFEERKAET